MWVREHWSGYVYVHAYAHPHTAPRPHIARTHRGGGQVRNGYNESDL